MRKNPYTIWVSKKNVEIKLVENLGMYENCPVYIRVMSITTLRESSEMIKHKT